MAHALWGQPRSRTPPRGQVVFRPRGTVRSAILRQTSSDELYKEYLNAMLPESVRHGIYRTAARTAARRRVRALVGPASATDRQRSPDRT